MTTLRKIKVSGDFFTYVDDGSEFHYVGISDFAQWKRFNMDNGPEALVRPICVERRQIADRAGYTGPIVCRVFRYSSPTNSFGVIPNLINPTNDYSKINAFLDMLAEYNMYADITCGDSQMSYMLPNPTDQQKDLNNFTTLIKRFCFIETCNEPMKNGWLPQNGVKPLSSDMYLRDSGMYNEISDTSQWLYQYDLDFISYHGDRTNDPVRWPKWVIDLDDQVSSLRSHVRLPAVLKEPNKFGPYYNDPSYAKCLGLRANMGGITWHSQLGLQSDGFDDAHKNACYEFFKGVAGSLR